jgi:uncharacterized protein YndB with AHSA1/START domain
MEPLELGFSVDCPVEPAFDLWSRRMSMWWPSGHSFSADPGMTVTFVPRVGGRIFERTPTGEEHHWGEVLVWEPPRRLVYLWHLRFDRSDATEVEVSFEPAGEATEVMTVHRGWERLGSVAEERRERNRRGWEGVTARYRAACSEGA